MGAEDMFDSDDLRPTIEITAFILTALSTLVVAARCYCRIWVVGRPKLYDYIMFTALVWTWGLCICNHYQLKFGIGFKGPVDLMDRKGVVASRYAYNINYLTDLTLIKMSILVFYLSFATTRIFRLVVQICIGLVAMFSTLLILIYALQCPGDPSYALNPDILDNRQTGHCFNLPRVLYWQAGFNIFSDLVILFLPMPVFLQIRMHKLKRISVLAVFSAGLLVPIASSIRLWGIYLWASKGPLGRYYSGYILLWSQVEINTAIICASAPSLQPLFKRTFGAIAPSIKARVSGPQHYGSNNRPIELSLSCGLRRGDKHVDEPTVSAVERPVPVHDAVRDQKVIHAITTDQLPEEEEVRIRVRAFSTKSTAPSLFTHPTQPSSILETEQIIRKLPI